MALKLRAIYENGHLRLLDPVTLREGEEVNIQLMPNPEEVDPATLSEDERRRRALQGLVQFPDPTYDEDAWAEAMQDELDKALQKGDKPLSQLIIEEREEGW